MSPPTVFAPSTPLRIAEALLFALMVVGVGEGIFSAAPGTFASAVFPFLSFSLLVWAALCFGPRGAAAAVLLLAIPVIAGTLRGLGPFASAAEPLLQPALVAQFFLGIIALTSPVLAAAVTEARRVELSLAENEEKYRTLMELLADGVFVAQDHRFVFANHALPAMLGYSADEFPDLTFDEVVAPRYLELWNERYERRIGKGPAPSQRYDL